MRHQYKRKKSVPRSSSAKKRKFNNPKLRAIGGRSAGSTRYKFTSKYRGKRRGARSRVRGRLAKRRGPASNYPGWFRVLTRLSAPTNVTGLYAGHLTAAANSKNTYAHWKSISLIDYQNVLTAAGVATSSTNPTYDAVKYYIAGLERKHTWTNNMSYGQVHVQFYCLTPRRSIPAAAIGVGVISPPSSNVSGTGGFLATPALYAQSFADDGKYTNAVGTVTTTSVAYSDAAATPFMSSALCSMFKIRPMMVTLPNGKKGSAGVLLPGESCTYTGKYLKPQMVSWNKFGLTGNSAGTLANTWEVLDNTPLILMQLRGTVSHSAASHLLINYGLAALDYINEFKYEIWRTTSATAQTMHATTTEAAFGDPEQTNVVDGGERAEADN